jgi:hypothetical protein
VCLFVLDASCDEGTMYQPNLLLHYSPLYIFRGEGLKQGFTAVLLHVEQSPVEMPKREPMACLVLASPDNANGKIQENRNFNNQNFISTNKTEGSSVA